MATLALYMGKIIAAEADPFARARELGFSAIEIAGYAMPWPEDSRGLDEWSDRLQRLGLQARYHCTPKDNTNFCSSDASARSASLTLTSRDLANASQLGIRDVIIHPSAAVSPEDRQRVIESIGILKEQADQIDIHLEMENGSGPFNGDPGELSRICEALPGVGICMDVGHVFRSEFCNRSAEGFIQWVKAAARHVSSIQFNDVRTEAGHARSAAVGRGEIPYVAVMPCLLALNCPWWTIELTEIDQIVATKEYLERFMT